MAALQGESAQQRWLHVGDTLLLFLRTRRGYVYSELSGLVAIERAWERFWACLFLLQLGRSLQARNKAYSYNLLDNLQCTLAASSSNSLNYGPPLSTAKQK